jgi:hypothetical protein
MDTIELSAQDVADEILEDLPDYLHPETILDAELAADINDFFGLSLTGDHAARLRANELTRDELVAIILPMRSWPALVATGKDIEKQ